MTSTSERPAPWLDVEEVQFIRKGTFFGAAITPGAGGGWARREAPEDGFLLTVGRRTIYVAASAIREARPRKQNGTAKWRRDL